MRLPVPARVLTCLALAASLTVAGAVPAAAQAPERRLTSWGDVIAFAWAADGQTLLVTRPTDVIPIPGGWRVRTDLWTVPVDGRAPVLLARNASQPAPGPLPAPVAFLRFDDAGRASLWILDEGGERFVDEADADIAPTWTDLGLVYHRQGRFQRLTDQGIQPVELPALARTSPPGQATPAPRGGRWAVTDGAGLLIVGPSGTTRVMGPPAPVSDVTWTSDGRQLAFVAGPSPAAQFWLTDAVEGTARRVFAGEMEHLGRPAWSPTPPGGGSSVSRLLIARTPTGSQMADYAELWAVDATGATTERLTANELEESDPAWSPTGTQVAFRRAGDVWLTDAATLLQGKIADADSRRFAQITPKQIGVHLRVSASPEFSAPPSMLTPPPTIRVYHTHFQPIGTIEVIAFETYIKRVVPQEMLASWNAESLKAQAVAARSYGWYQVWLHAGSAWDVTDWTDYQVCGPDSQCDPRSDAATDATAGQYVYHPAYPGEPICAFYSAEQGDPTEAYGDVSYLRAVSDPVCFGQTRRGHGWGLCQWGARRWADSYGWDYQQMLSHYYTTVAVDLPAGPSPDTGPPLVSLTGPWGGWYVTSNRAFVTANASDEQSGIAQVDFHVVYSTTTGVTTTQVGTDTTDADGCGVVWDLAGVPDQPLLDATVGLTATAYDVSGHVNAASIVVGLDRHPPTVTVGLLEPVMLGITLTLALTATDDGPGQQSGVTSVALSNDWLWEAEDVYATYHIPGDCGTVVTDAAALNGQAWAGLAGVHPPGDWYGPYTWTLPPGRDYLALFRLKTTAVTVTAEVARLFVGVDAGAAGARILGLRSVRGVDFRAAGEYQEFGVRFRYAGATTNGVEFIVQYRGVVDLWADRILVVSDPVPLTSPFVWTCEGNERVLVKVFDAAGNPSADAVVMVPPLHRVYLPLVACP